ncbi:flagellar protein FlaG [Serpentinicella sp. ANB-PHB4]|uniref:flagellar protein FlaG n=1 Tax=Serpentinicella sp. ANB-PHB4 TaxID=3074076 RepID=UPI00285EBDE2|nr:flagellar protein FlaG [Serpentinicella sp. ANB-PHB4]MDR5658470.1 flagellar protein FlaG [Serpentinicella sp. ANB-PHB4]
MNVLRIEFNQWAQSHYNGLGHNSEIKSQQESKNYINKVEDQLNIKKEKLIQILPSLRDYKSTTLQFDIHEETNRLIVKVMDVENKEVIKEFPSEKILDILSKTWEIAGLVADEYT